VHRLDPNLRAAIRIVVPCAPSVMEDDEGWWPGMLNSWFTYADDGEPAIAEELVQQRARILTILESERQRLPDCDGRRLVVGGLSQGASLAIDVGLRAPFAIGGVLSLRGCVLQASLGDCGGHPDGLEVLATHGERDSICPVEDARQSYARLRQCAAVKLQLETDPYLAHACARGRQVQSELELRHIAEFLSRVWQPFIANQ